MSFDSVYWLIGSVFQRWGILLKNEFLEVLLIDKVCFILWTLVSWVDPGKKVMKLLMLGLVDGFLVI